MKNKMKFIATAIALVIGLGAFTSQVLAQHGDHMYHIQHVVEGANHVVIFKPVTMPAGYKEYSMVEGREIVRLNCRVESVAKSVSNTKIKLGRNAAGERVIEEIQVPGEKVKHVF